MLALALLASCGGGDSPTGPQAVATVTLGPSGASLAALGQTLTLTVSAADARGRAVAGAPVSWATSDASVASVAAGVVTAVGNGTTTITATSGSAAGSLRVTVQQLASQLAFVGGTDTLYAVGDSARVRVEVRDAGGHPMPTDSAAVRFSSDTPDLLTVESGGLVIARTDGVGLVRAVLGTLSRVQPLVVRQRAARLHVVHAPVEARAGLPLDSLVVEIRDTRGARVLTDDTTLVTASLADVPTGVVAGGSVRASSGRAVFTTLTLGATAGSHVVRVAAPGLAPASSEPLVLRAGAPRRLFARSDTTVTALAGTQVTSALRTRTEDAWGNAVANAAVVYDVVSGDARLADTTATTDASGEAGVGVTLGRHAGDAIVRARIDSADVAFRLTGTPNGVIAGVVQLASAGAPAQPLAASRPNAASSRGANANRVSTATRRTLDDAAASAMPGDIPDELLVTYYPTVHAEARVLTDGPSAARRAVTSVRRVQAALRGALDAPELQSLVEPLGASPLTLTTRVRLRPGIARAVALQRLRADPRVRSVEANVRVTSARAPSASLRRYVEFARSTTTARGRAVRGVPTLAVRRDRFDLDEAFPLPGLYPTASRFVEQAWHYNAARFPQVWTVSEGSASVLVAVVDDGIRFDHPAIAARLTNDGYDFVSEQLVPRCAGGSISNTGDGDGYDPDPTIPEGWERAGNCLVRLDADGAHGLHVATTISAEPNNVSGLVGGTVHTRIRPVRALGPGGGTAYDVAQAILYAAGLPADNGAGGTVTPAGGAAHIVNLSLGSSSPSAVIQAAVEQAHAAGVLLVASSGNAGNTVRNYPAAYPEVLSVTAVDPALQRAWYATYGSTVDLAAPGGDVSVNSTHGVLSAAWDFVNGVPRTGSWNGTSMAAPHVSAAAALLKAVEPSLDAAALRARLLASAIDLGAPGPDAEFGAGLLNVDGAVRGVPARAVHVVLVDAETGAERARTRVDAGGAYAFPALPDGRYWLFAGTDEQGDGALGLPGRVWGADGGGATPRAIVVDGADTYASTFTVTPTTEVEPNNTRAQANVLFAGGYALGTIAATNDADHFVLSVPQSGTWRITATGQVGACGFARESDVRLSLLDAAGQVIQTSLNIDTNAGNRCASITRTLSAGRYGVLVEGSTVGTYLVRVSARPAGP